MISSLKMALPLVLVSILASQSAGAAPDYTGLWSGMVVVDAVSEPASDRPDRPTPASGEMSFRLLLHVDQKGRIKLLKEATLLWQPGGEEGEGGYLLITDPKVLKHHLAAIEGTPKGRRLSSAAIDFRGDSLVVRGDLAPGKVVWVTAEVPTDLPTNPFRHPFHPDHDNLDDAGRPSPAGRQEVFAVTRQIELKLDEADRKSGPAPVLSGQYRETLSGLHRMPIQVAGRIELRRVSAIPTIEY